MALDDKEAVAAGEAAIIQLREIENQDPACVCQFQGNQSKGNATRQQWVFVANQIWLNRHFLGQDQAHALRRDWVLGISGFP